VKLLHGTTRHRAESILRDGPDPDYQEPGGERDDTGFSMSLATGPFPFGTPEQYARRKARAFPNEGGPAILEVEVPDETVALAVNEWFPLSQGLVQFNIGSGLEELLNSWPIFEKCIVPVGFR
jgi:hypothetical protein